jgi:rhodanese-related sulfurtransferase
MDVLIHGANVLRNKMDGLLKSTSATEFQARRDDGEEMLLLDVRTPDEYQAACIPNSTLMPLGSLRSRGDQLPHDKPILAYCKSSLRAWEGARILAGMGYDNVEVIEGGMLAWPYQTVQGT